MFEDMTYEVLLREKLAQVSSALDKREGSVIHDSLAPNSLESAMLYIALDSILKETFADTASRDYLILRCAERGITPLPATAAVGIGSFNIAVPIGSRFSCDRYNWVVTEEIGNGKYYMTCETPGVAPNGYTGTLIPVDYIEGLTSAELTEISIPGEDEEDTEELRMRYKNSYRYQSYGFNRAQYIETVEAIPGVGRCKPYRARYGPGTVGLVITDSDYGVPSKTLVDTVQEAIDPVQNKGEGLGLAPIDHEVSVEAVTGTEINISAKLEFANGWTLEKCMPYITETLDSYYRELNAAWGGESSLTVRILQIESRILELEGITDISDTKINGSSRNIELSEDSIAVRGEFSNA